MVGRTGGAVTQSLRLRFRFFLATGACFVWEQISLYVRQGPTDEQDYCVAMRDCEVGSVVVDQDGLPCTIIT